jgi:hypothetical protein
MTYSIIFYANGRELGSSPWDRGLDAAKEHAKAADRVEVRDDRGALVFQFPRAVSPA